VLHNVKRTDRLFTPVKKLMDARSLKNLSDPKPLECLSLIARPWVRGRASSNMPNQKRSSRTPTRCAWACSDLAIGYHDKEWGVPAHGDGTLFEFLILEGAQAGLSWETILNKRENYRAAFDRFDPRAVARYDRRKKQRLLNDAGIVRNRLKIDSAVKNARAFLRVQKEFGSFDRYIWQFVGGKPRLNAWRLPRQVPARTAESDAMSKDLKKRGFNFVGSTICYAFMQAVGMVNDHSVKCFRYKVLISKR
jgi:DNA-3-methyladenine glycosylase I